MHEWLHFLIRKSAHFAEYFVFGLLLLRTVRGEHQGWMLHWALIVLAITAGYAALDEFHQSFVPSRTASSFELPELAMRFQHGFLLNVFSIFGVAHDAKS